MWLVARDVLQTGDKGRHFEPEIIILCVRRYLGYALSVSNLEEIMAKRTVHVVVRQ